MIKTLGASDIAILPWRLPLHHRSHRLWRVQDLTVLVRDPLLSFAVLSSSAQGRHKRKVVWLLCIVTQTSSFSVSLSGT